VKYLLVEDLMSESGPPSTFELTRQEVVDLGAGGIGLPVLLLDLLLAGWPPPPTSFILAMAQTSSPRAAKALRRAEVSRRHRPSYRGS
jgi:hypothetical protein